MSCKGRRIRVCVLLDTCGWGGSSCFPAARVCGAGGWGLTDLGDRRQRSLLGLQAEVFHFGLLAHGNSVRSSSKGEINAGLGGA